MDQIKIVSKQNKIGGWLSLLVFTLLVIVPISGLINLYVQYLTTNDYFASVKGLKSYVILSFITNIILIIFSIWSGISLIKLKSNAINLTKTYLILFLVNGLLQKPYTNLVDLDLNYKGVISEQISANIGYSIFFFIIWFTYLIFSERVEKTFNIKEVKVLSYNKIVMVKLGVIKDSLKEQLVNVFNLFNQYRKKLNIVITNHVSKLKSDEIVVISLVIATLVSLIIGYQLGETKYFLYSGERINKHYRGQTYDEFNFNYLSAISSFIIFGGILYMYLKVKSKK